MVRFRITWETYTDESAEAGDAEARGFLVAGDYNAEDPRTVSPDRLRLREAIEALALEAEPWRALEAIETDSTGSGGAAYWDRRARWVEATYRFGASGPARELPGGESIIGARLALHIPENVTAASRARIVRAVRSAL